MADQAEPRSTPPKSDPESLTLRARPRPVTRFSRKVLIAGAALGSAAILGATLVALDPPTFREERRGDELYSTERKPTAEGLAELPSDYGDMPKPTPELGPPLPGDVGPPVVDMERDLGVAPPSVPAFRPDPEADAARAERLRLAQQARKARESEVFFQISARQGTTDAAANPGTGQGASDPYVDGSDDQSRLALDPARDQNHQGRKLDFLNQRVDDAVYNPHPLQDPVSPYVVMAGTAIQASLVTGINSDLPGLVIAQVTGNVYDTPTGRHLLIPQGARLIGEYDSVVAFGQSRALVIWNRIVMPDGSSIVIENLPATDTAGYAGLEDEVDYHTWRLIAGVALSTLLGVGTELTFGEEEGNLLRAIRESAQRDANRAGQRITERNLNIQPTITVRPGWPLRVIVHKDLVLRPYRG
ncbi:TrbI/VirB10 family protein [Oceanibaculum pacificum]|uniref:Conjugal transfer protein TrbI n=1 Tax=Oceanibaculum pacificum TaxID=580166 RepID=A0A154W1J1_9PROT|nr:TrbI/VirB10 family protein [Oceanibaculum pacificum]KZD07376.1 conjugal transfer protein TrbI [Oceanibaculum pacificum]